MQLAYYYVHRKVKPYVYVYTSRLGQYVGPQLHFKSSIIGLITYYDFCKWVKKVPIFDVNISRRPKVENRRSIVSIGPKPRYLKLFNWRGQLDIAYSTQFEAI